MKRLLLLCSLFAIAAADTPKGTLCFGGEKNCIATKGFAFDIKPADTDRQFVWTSDDGANVVLGNAPANPQGLALPAAVRDQEAWQEYFAFVESLMKRDVPQEPWKFNREEIYEERLGRWLNPPDP